MDSIDLENLLFEECKMEMDAPPKKKMRSIKKTGEIYLVERQMNDDGTCDPNSAWVCKLTTKEQVSCAERNVMNAPLQSEAYGGKSALIFKTKRGERYVMSPELASMVEEGFILSVDKKNIAHVEWSIMFNQLHVSADELEAVSREYGSSDEDEKLVRVVYLALSGKVLTQADVQLLSDYQVSRLLELLEAKGVMLDGAKSYKSIMGDGHTDTAKARLRYAVILCRKSEPYDGAWPFAKEEFSENLKWLPTAYKDVVHEIARKVESLCGSGKRPIIMLKAADGAPAREVATELARRLSRAGSCVRLDGASFTSPIDLMGENPGYRDSNVGRLARAICGSKARSIVFEGAHRLSNLKKGDGDPVGFLRQCLADDCYPVDSFLELPMNLSTVPFVLTEPSSITSEFDECCDAVFTLPGLSRDQKIQAACEMLDNYGLEIDQKAAELLVDNYAYDSGISMLSTALETIAEGIDVAHLVVDEKTVETLLPTPNRQDPRYWVASRRERLEQAGGQSLAMAENLLASILEESDNRMERERNTKRLQMQLGVTPNGERIPVPTKEEFVAQVQETHPGLTPYDMDVLTASILASVRNRYHPRPILLVGPAGTGKTTIIESVAQALGGVHVVKKDMPALSTSELFGAANAMPSVLTESASLYDGAPGVFHLDECDKMPPNMCNSQSLCSLLDEGVINDCYLNLGVDFSKWLIILTANDLDRVSPYVVNRSQIVRLEGYPPASKVLIARRALIARKARQLGIDEPVVDDQVLEYLAMIDDDAGIRTFENRLEVTLSEFQSEEGISMEDIQRLYPCLNKELHGIAVLMARGGAKGGAALGSVASVKMPRPNGVSPKPAYALGSSEAFDCTLSKAAVALTIGMRTDTSGLCAALQDADDLNHTLASQGTLATAIALWCSANDFDPYCPHTAFVGDLEMTGHVKQVDEEFLVKGVFMVARAAKYDIDVIAVPQNLASDPSTAQAARAQGVKLVSVAHLKDAVQLFQDRCGLSDLLDELGGLDFGV